MRPRLLSFARLWLLILAAAVAARAALPWAVKAYVNRVLDRLPGYGGRVEEVDVHLWRGAYGIRGLRIFRKRAGERDPLLSADKIDLSVAWKDLLHGALVAEVALENPRFNVLARAPREEAAPAGPGAPAREDPEKTWTGAARDLFPLRINRFVVDGGEVLAPEPGGRPGEEVLLDRLRLEARNLTNSERLSKTLMASVTGNARVLGDGTVTLHVDLNPFQADPSFNLDMTLAGMDLARLNGVFRRSADIEVRAGRMDAYVECAAAGGAFKGYVKPIVTGLEVGEEGKKPLGRAVKEAAAEAVAKLLRNRKRDSVATRLEFSGRFEGPRVGTWTAVATALRHAFVQALRPGLDRSIGFKDVSPTEDGKKG